MNVVKDVIVHRGCKNQDLLFLALDVFWSNKGLLEIWRVLTKIKLSLILGYEAAIINCWGSQISSPRSSKFKIRFTKLICSHQLYFPQKCLRTCFHCMGIKLYFTKFPLLFILGTEMIMCYSRQGQNLSTVFDKMTRQHGEFK